MKERDYIDDLLLAFWSVDIENLHDWFWDMIAEYFTHE